MPRRNRRCEFAASRTKYSYDAENRTISMDNGAATYTYNAKGQRVTKTIGSTTTDFTYDREGHIILMNPATPTFIEMYTAGSHLGTYVLNSARTDTVFYYDHADWLGTERARTNLSGTACETISLPFGDAQSISGSCGDISPAHFTSKVFLFVCRVVFQQRCKQLRNIHFAYSVSLGPAKVCPPLPRKDFGLLGARRKLLRCPQKNIPNRNISPVGDSHHALLGWSTSLSSYSPERGCPCDHARRLTCHTLPGRPDCSSPCHESLH